MVKAATAFVDALRTEFSSISAGTSSAQEASEPQGEDIMLGSGRLALVAFALIAGCATGHEAMKGTVVMKVNDTQAHVCVFDQPATVGSHVQLYRHTCVSPYGKKYQCDKQPVAVGTVTEQIGDHYALVTFPAGTNYEEGFTVEPIP
jgi:hypothetical protein